MAEFFPNEDFEGPNLHVRSQTFIFTGTSATRTKARDSRDWLNEEESFGPGLEIEKLKIGTPKKQHVSPKQSSPLMLCASDSSSSSRPRSPPGNIECRPLWEDYPLVEKCLPSGQSYCSNPITCYTASSLYNPGFNGFKPNYKSSSLGTIFGSQKSLISPPKLTTTNWGYQQQDGSVYGCGSYPFSSNGSVCQDNGASNSLCRPVSRASSQSSGFVSQSGYYTPPPSLHGFKVTPSATTSWRNKNRSDSNPTGTRVSHVSWCSSRVSNGFPAEKIGSPYGTESSLFGTLRNQTRSSSYDTCSRFARSEDDRQKVHYGSTQQGTRAYRSNSGELTDEDTDDSTSFCTARTSATKVVWGRVDVETEGIRRRNIGNCINGGIPLRNLKSSEFEENRPSTASVCTTVGRFTWNVARNLLLLVGVVIMLMLLGMIFTDLNGEKIQEGIRYLITYISVFRDNLENIVTEHYRSVVTSLEPVLSETKQKVVEALTDFV